MGRWQFFKNGQVPVYHDHDPWPSGKNKHLAFPLEVVGRQEWGALPNNDEDPLLLPVKFVRQTQTGTDQCANREECMQWMQRTQEKDMRDGLPDIKFNFYVGGDGTVLEGRGWKLDASRTNPNVDLSALKEDCIDIAYIGTFKERGEDIPEIMSSKSKLIIGYGVVNKMISCCHTDIPFNNFE